LVDSITLSYPVVDMAVWDGGKIAFTTTSGNVIVTDYSLNITAQLGDTYYADGETSVVIFQSDGDIAYGVLDLGGTIVLRDKNLVYKTLNSGFGSFSDIAVQSDDDIVVTSPTAVYVRDAETLLNNGYNSGFTFDPNNTFIAIQSNDNIVAGDGIFVGVYDEAMVYTGSSTYGWGGVYDLAIQSDNDIVIADASEGGSVHIRNPDVSYKDPLTYDAPYGTINNLAIVFPEPLTNYDLYSDNYIDFADFAKLAQNWLSCNVPDQAGCIENW
jgi:hypothetical protein